ncbi:DNA translocase FtsK 4TM domain-containing protein [Candidatus Fermentibacteria bacterium]|nr:DNA translocase FtsK 4TM domain-containing protein [Candidatus Fermentibacteria bacterium]
MNTGRVVSGAAVARLVLALAVAALVSASLATYRHEDWFNLRRDSLLKVRVENTCGIVGAATAHLLSVGLGRIPAFSVVVFITLAGMSVVWRDLRRRLWYWLGMVTVATLVLTTALAMHPIGSVPAWAGGAVGVRISTLGMRALGPSGMTIVLTVAGLLLPFHALGGFKLHLRLPRRRQRPVARGSSTPVPAPFMEGVTQEGMAERTPSPVVESEPEPTPSRIKADAWPYKLPPSTLLRADGPMHSFVDPKEIERRRVKLEEALGSFGVTAKVVRAVPGPVITRFEVEPAPGIKVARIESLADDISLALKALQTRVVAPIPGTGVVGVEVPNRRAAVVRLGDMMRSPVFRSSDAPLLLPVGRDAVGEPVACDLSTLPHLLIGGTTGSGKSSCINSFLCGLLVRVTPHLVRFLLIDPKRVELTTYEGIPHLLYPVVTDPKVALRSLTWTAQEMERRYELLSTLGMRDIGEFHSQEAENGNTMPYIVVVIDELADLMMSAPAEMEAVIIRIAQKARAVGIHLIVATQRPSKEIVTGVLKSNFPGRIAFQVMQRVNSTIILDSPGAERLLGKGDMLFLPPGAPGPQRVHGGFITPEEVRSLVDFWRSQVQIAPASRDRAPSASGLPPKAPPVPTTIDLGEMVEPGDDDSLWEDAARLVILNRQGSTSLLQRRLKVGYARAGRLMDILENRGVVGPAQGSKPRDVLVDSAWLENTDNIGS